MSTGKKRSILLLLFIEDPMKKEWCTNLYHILPKERAKKADFYKHEKDRQNCILVYCLLKYALIHEFGIKKMPLITCTQFGKPFFKDQNFPCFNWSHCKKGVCCAVSSKEIGCDIQETIADSRQLIQHCLHRNEREGIFRKNTEATFTKYWTLKESYLKYIGTGITNELSTYDFSDCRGQTGNAVRDECRFVWNCRGDVCYSCCSEEPVLIRELTLADLYMDFYPNL